MQKKLIISLKDLQFISIGCPRCYTRVVLDMDREDFKVGGKTFFAPSAYPGCRELLDSSIPQNVDTLHRVYRAIPAELSARITFSVDIGPDSNRKSSSRMGQFELPG